MSERRRFFPATPVQQVPGRTVELEMQLRPEAPVAAPTPAPAPAPVGECDLFGAGWWTGSDLWSRHAEVMRVDVQSDGRTRIWVDSDGLDSLWEGVPAHFDEHGRARPISGPEFHCTYLSVWPRWDARDFYAVLQGRAMTDARWQFSWEGEPEGEWVSAFGDVVETWGNVLHVIAGADITGSGGESLLTARAFCGSRQVAELRLRLVWGGW